MGFESVTKIISLRVKQPKGIICLLHASQFRFWSFATLVRDRNIVVFNGNGDSLGVFSALCSLWFGLVGFVTHGNSIKTLPGWFRAGAVGNTLKILL